MNYVIMTAVMWALIGRLERLIQALRLPTLILKLLYFEHTRSSYLSLAGG